MVKKISKKEILEYCESEDQLNEREKFWIKELNSRSPNGYNLTVGGDGSGTDWFEKHPDRELIRNKMGKHLIGKHHSKETRKKISESHKGKKGKSQSEETKRKNSESHIGKHPLPSSIEKSARAKW